MARRFLDRSESAQPRQRAFDPQRPLVHHVRIDHGDSNIFVAKQLLNGSDVISVFQQVCCEAVPQAMTAAVLVDTGCGYRLLYLALDGRFSEVMAAGLARARIDNGVSRGEQVLPAHCLAALGYFRSSALRKATICASPISLGWRLP